MVEKNGSVATRTRILEAAREISADKGMHAVTVRAVSEAAGVGMGTLRHHFKSQRALFAELVTDVIDDRLDDSAIVDITLSGPDRLVRAVGQFLPLDYADAATVSGWFDIYATAFAQPPSGYSRELLDAASRRAHHHMRIWLARLAEEGWIDAGRIDEAADTLIALSSGLLLETLTAGSPVTFESARATLAFAARAVLRDAPRMPGILGDDARSRFRAPSRTLPVTARENPEHAIFLSNESGTFNVHAWNRVNDRRWQMTDAPLGTSLCGISPDGQTVWTFQDAAGSEFGNWCVARFPQSGDETPTWHPILATTPGTPLGHALGSSLSVLSLATADGSTVWVVEGPPDAPHERPLISDRAMMTVYAMDAAEGRVAIGVAEDGSSIRPQVRVLRISDAAEVAHIWDGPDNGLEVSGFAPLAGDPRLLMAHERNGFRRAFVWNTETDERIELDLDLTGELWARWYPDAVHLLISHTEKGRMRLYRYALDTGELAPVSARPGWIGTGAVRSDGAIEYLWCDAAHPPQHRVIEPDGTDRSVVSDDQEARPSRPLRDAYIPLLDEPGESLHLLYAVPGDELIPRPTVFMVHGGPYAADEDYFSPARAAWLDAGFAVVHVNYRGSTGYGRRWRDAIIGDPGRRAVSDLEQARIWAVASGIARASQCVIEGWSWGGYLALLAAGLHPGSWMACVAGAPIADYVLTYDEQPEMLRAFDRDLFEGSPSEKPELFAASSPRTYVSAIDCPILLLLGRNDPRTPPGQIAAFVERLRAHEKPHEVYEFDGGHGSLDVGESVRQIETEIGFASRVLLRTYGHDSLPAQALQARGGQRS